MPEDTSRPTVLTNDLVNGTPCSEEAVSEPQLIAYRISRWPKVRLAPAPMSRQWISQLGGFPSRCLPLLIGNQAGWMILSCHKLRITWDGSESVSSLSIEYLEGFAPYPALSHFGHGIVTWTIPFLFRTPPGYNLLVRGPSNMPKDGIYPLDGIVETDWAEATFTMNWKVTRPDNPVVFDVDEPVAMILPQRRGELERFRPEVRELSDEAQLANGYQAWSSSRADFLRRPRGLADESTWQKHYFKGVAPSGSRSREHQTRLRLREFHDAKGDAGS